ncbi:Secretion system effector C (SseC) like family protein [Variovorax sp. PBS-H4]|uniref:hypothetical protein n=1 Tax=Variovorax sp. PBS-H4 TaxID=434008 RepID=UPI0013162535|nr:hypothetical protein [Variovorax sp. PBS-H4]VTU27119.1 Secretion system effector C (SseC) like family protein [Variovorax sp. PBS-H4]
MPKVDSSPPLVNLTGLWGDFTATSIGIKAPLLALADVPSSGAAWMQTVRPPTLDAPDLKIDSISCYIASLQSTFTALQMKVHLDSIENNKLQKKADFEKAQEQQRVADEKAKEAAEAAKKAMVLEWLSAVAAVIGAVLAAVGAAVVTGGLAVGLAVVGVVMAVQTLTNTAIKQAQMDGKKITTTDAMGKEHQLSLSWGLAVEMAQAKVVADGGILRTDDNGHIIDATGKVMSKEQVLAAREKNPFMRVMTEDEMGKERLAVTLVIEIGIAVAMIGCGVRAMVNAGKNAAEAVEKSTKSVRLGIQASQKTWERFGRLSEGLSSATEIVGGASDIAQGKNGIDIAQLQFESSNATAEQFFYEKKMKVAMVILRELEASCKKLVAIMSETYDAMSEQVKELGDVRDSIARKINQTAS